MFANARRYSIVAILVACALATFPAVPYANHSWNGYHWARTSNPFNVTLGDNVNANWDAHLAIASADWSLSSVLDAPVVAGRANPKNCRPTAGGVQICNATYGKTGWLGVAQIWVSGLHITQGTVKLNDTYFNTAQYNTYAWRQLVACQEIGHTFGLTHQDETFSNTNLGTCMDYTNDPDGTLSGQLDNEHPNQHDYDELVTIYSHLDSTTTTSGSPAGSGADVDNPAAWGQLMKSVHGGRAQVFERDLGNGERIVTFVIWA
jgi:hypothetical protein